MVVVDGQGIPIGAQLASAQISEFRLAESTLARVRVPRGGRGRPRKRLRRVIADRGYDSDKLRQRAFREPELGDLRGRKLRSDRYTLAVDHHHALRTFPATGFSDCRAPFFASTKVASRKASSQSSNFRSSNRASNACHARSHTPCSSHRRRRRQQVQPWGYSLGRSRHRAPTRRTQRMPSKQLRLEAQGRPRPSFRRCGAGNKSSICFHCWSVSIMTTANLNQQHLLKYQL